MKVMVWALVLPLAVACSSSGGGSSDAQGQDTTGLDTTQDTGQQQECGFTEPMALEPDYAGPQNGDSLTYRLTIEVCLPGQIEGIRREEVFDGSGDVLCTSTSRFSATSTFSGTWCDRCTALTGATFAAPVQTGDYCTEASITADVPTDFDGNAFETLAVRDFDSHMNDVLYLSQAGDWVPMVPPVTATATISRFFTMFPFGNRATVRWEEEGRIYGN